MSKPLRVLTVIETLGRGGAEQALINLLPELRKLGIHCEVAMLFKKDDLVYDLERQGIKVHQLDLSYKWNLVEGVIKLYKLIKGNDFEIVHAHLFFAYFYTGLIKALHPKTKTVTTFHNLGYNAYPANTFLKKSRKILAAFVITRLIDKKVAVSEAVRKHYTQHLGIDHVDLIHNAIPLADIGCPSNLLRYQVLAQYKPDYANYKNISITPGRLVKEKGHLVLLKALQDLGRRNVELLHFIVGAGPLEKELIRIISENKIVGVVLIPGLPQNKLFELILACDFVAVPSISEGFGMVIVEAMALQKPVIATAIDGITDVVENQKEALLVPPGDSVRLAKAMEKFCQDSSLTDKLRKNARIKVEQFDTRIIAHTWKRYYEDLYSAD